MANEYHCPVEMSVMGFSDIKRNIKQAAIKGVNATGISSKYYGTPKRMMSTADWVAKYGKAYNAGYEQLSAPKTLHQKPPITLDAQPHKIYRDEYEYEQWASFVATIPGGRVWGRSCAVITPDDVLLEDVSREFGRTGGVTGAEHTVNKQLKLNKCTLVKGKVAVIGCAGAYNFGHWMFDILPRIQLLKLAGVFEEIDHFVVDYTGLPFQKDSFKTLGIPEEKLILANDGWKFHIEAETLIVPSLPARLGTYGDWSTPFIRQTFLKEKREQPVRLYISRKKAANRKVANETEVLEYLGKKGFIEFFAEDHSVSDTAAYFAAAEYVIGVHGSGLVNFAFLSKGAKVIDVLPPALTVPYFWILSNFAGAHYAYLNSEGERPDEQVDLVVNKVDDDITINLAELDRLFNILDEQAC